MYNSLIALSRLPCFQGDQRKIHAPPHYPIYLLHHAPRSVRWTESVKLSSHEFYGRDSNSGLMHCVVSHSLFIPWLFVCNRPMATTNVSFSCFHMTSGTFISIHAKFSVLPPSLSPRFLGWDVEMRCGRSGSRQFPNLLFLYLSGEPIPKRFFQGSESQDGSDDRAQRLLSWTAELPMVGRCVDRMLNSSAVLFLWSFYLAEATQHFCLPVISGLFCFYFLTCLGLHDLHDFKRSNPVPEKNF